MCSSLIKNLKNKTQRLHEQVGDHDLDFDHYWLKPTTVTRLEYSMQFRTSNTTILQINTTEGSQQQVQKHKS